MTITNGLILNNGNLVNIVTISSDIDIGRNFNNTSIVQLDLSSNNIAVTLNQLSKNQIITFKIIANNGNAATFKGINNNFEDEDIQIGNDPVLGTLTLAYDIKNNFWRTIGVE